MLYTEFDGLITNDDFNSNVSKAIRKRLPMNLSHSNSTSHSHPNFISHFRVEVCFDSEFLAVSASSAIQERNFSQASLALKYRKNRKSTKTSTTFYLTYIIHTYNTLYLTNNHLSLVFLLYKASSL